MRICNRFGGILDSGNSINISSVISPGLIFRRLPLSWICTWGTIQDGLIIRGGLVFQLIRYYLFSCFGTSDPLACS
jgi:hypothetical protein